MAGMQGPMVISLLLFLQLLVSASSSSTLSTEGLSSYVVHVASSLRPRAFRSPADWYASVLASVSGLPLHQARQRHGPHYTYETVLHGFSAKLTPQQASLLLQRPGFLGAFRDKRLQLHTTRTPEFLLLTPDDGLWPSSSYGEDVIVGVLDTGVWPERASFSDEGFAEVPSRWQGACEEGTAFNSSSCNRKLIGARFFYKGYEAAAGPIDDSSEFKSPRDSEGHGSHTSSTAAGNFVSNVSLFSYAYGDARGMAPNARVAMYKICWDSGCYDSDILAAFESALSDGVDIISLSVGGSVVPFYKDSIAIGSFAATQNGVLVSCSAGNSGPYAQSVTNVAPWVVTVAASSVDRKFPAPVVLGDGSSYEGASLYGGMEAWQEGQQLPLIYAGDAVANGSTAAKACLCVKGTLDPAKVEGKIVLCDRGTNARVTKGLVVKNAGGAGMILANTAESGAELLADSHLIPAALVGFDEGVAIKAYISAAGINATASIYFNGTALGVKPAPVVTAFSSRGPNLLPPEILKPDVTAPGLNILAAYTGVVGPTGLDGDDRIVDYSMMSGTSMSCPHVSGLVALLKASHPAWSPSAIKSALMTTAYTTDNSGNSLSADCSLGTPFAYGSGHINPQSALDPGLVYDIDTQGYVDFLCSLGYGGGADLEIFTKGEFACSSNSTTVHDLNYPSVSVILGDGDTVSVSRTVTNVGATANVTYSAAVTGAAGVNVTVTPSTLEFGEGVESLSFSVTFVRDVAAALPILQQEKHVFGSLAWTDDEGVHTVRSPIVVTLAPLSKIASS